MPTSTVTRALRRLESHGYVTLEKGTFLDARVLRPALTEYGAGIRRNVVGFELQLDRVLAGDMRPLELGAFIVALTHIASCPRAVADLPPPPSTPRLLPYEAFAPPHLRRVQTPGGNAAAPAPTPEPAPTPATTSAPTPVTPLPPTDSIDPFDIF